MRRENEGLSMSFVDVFSLSFLAILVIYTTTISDQKIKAEEIEYEILIVDQSDQLVDHLATISVDIGGKRHIWFNKNRYFNIDYDDPVTSSPIQYQKYNIDNILDFTSLIQNKFGISISVSSKEPKRVAINTTNIIENVEIYVGYQLCREVRILHPIECQIMRSGEDEILNLERSIFREGDSILWKNSTSVWYPSGNREYIKAINQIKVKCKKGGNSSIKTL